MMGHPSIAENIRTFSILDRWLVRASGMPRWSAMPSALRCHTSSPNHRPAMDAVDGHDSSTLDGNYPLADQTLNFDVKIAEVREASEDEVEHGHVHGEGDHQQ